MKMKVQAQYLQRGDVVGSGEIVMNISAGINTPSNKVDVQLDHRYAQWGKYTIINVERA